MDSNELPPSSPPPPPPLSAPPSFTGPPPVIMPPPSPAPRRGRGWMIFAVILLALLGISLLANFGQWVSSGLSPVRGVVRHHRIAGPRLDQVTLENNNATYNIAVVDINGIITSNPLDQGGSTMVDVLRAQLERAKEDDNVKAVVLRVDSPGGEVLASDEIYRAIKEFQDSSGKPVVASMANLAASGGYYVSAPCQWIVANELTITGSIGVILQTWNYRALMNKVGLTPQVYKSGKHKDMLSGGRLPEEIPAEERAMIQSLIDETYTRFKTVVREGRGYSLERNKQSGRPLANDWEGYADGRILSGKEAYEHGFVDQLGTFQDAVKKAREFAGISRADLIKYQLRYDLSDFFRIFGKAEPPAIKIDLGVQAPKLEAGQLYFLSPTFLH